jgi:hypothetical protein
MVNDELIKIIKKLVRDVKDIDDAMEKINKVTDNGLSYDKFDNAKSIIEISGTVRTDGHDWYFETEDAIFTANVPTALDELIGKDTEKDDKYKIIIEKLN